MEPVIQHVQQHLGVYVAGAALILPLLYIYRKRTAPVLYHSAEYLIYCTVFHIVMGGLIRVGSWFRLETKFKNNDGTIAADFNPLTNPLNVHFWDKELYSPQWLFYVEIAAAMGLLYLIIAIRPMRFKKNIYQGRVEKSPTDKKKARQREALSLSSRRRTDAQRLRLQRIRNKR